MKNSRKKQGIKNTITTPQGFKPKKIKNIGILAEFRVFMKKGMRLEIRSQVFYIISYAARSILFSRASFFQVFYFLSKEVGTF